MTGVEFLIDELPDPEAARRFLAQLEEKHPSQSKKLLANDALLSDVATLVSYSPLIATTLLQNPDHLAWLNQQRMASGVREKEELLESLARFSLTHSQLEPHVTLTRFRRRELIRIFLRDIRRLATIAEITEEISNLADAILEYGLRLTRQELDNRFGQPQEMDERGRNRPAEFSIVSLGKLGSKELNYSSDIDLLFIYSSDGTTSGSGTRGATSNLEYFSRLAESVTKLVGGQGGEGAAYRVDMRLRPHGRVGPLALSLKDTIRYYKTEAAAWERQVLIRSRVSAGSEKLFRKFFRSVVDVVFSAEETVENALQNVGLSKQKIDLKNRAHSGSDIKLGRGGIREIEFIAQALQLAHGGKDDWLRAPHTLISLSRLADRNHISPAELTQLFDAYDFLRRLEHILQMEDGLQTHSVPIDEQRRHIIAKRIGLNTSRQLNAAVVQHTNDVNRIFKRVFSAVSLELSAGEALASEGTLETEARKADIHDDPSFSKIKAKLRNAAPRFAALVESHPYLLDGLSEIANTFPEKAYPEIFNSAVGTTKKFREQLEHLRRAWLTQLVEIVVYDSVGKLKLTECKRLQTQLAEASIETALQITKSEIERRYEIVIDEFPLAILALGKLGGGGMDYDSDLDLVMVYDDWQNPDRQGGLISQPEFFSRAVEIFTTVLSSITRDGSLYRVDLRLRPHGGDGPLVNSRSAFAEYFQSKAAIWEMLAFVKLRAVGGHMSLATSIENEIRSIIHERVANIDPFLLAEETRSVRSRLEKQKTGRRTKEIDIKYGAGGLLDVYFAIRYLQLVYDIRDQGDDRSTLTTLNRIVEELQKPDCQGGRNTQLPDNALAHAWASAFDSLRSGYEFLTALDHSLRLAVGRTTRLPQANSRSLDTIATRIGLSGASELLEKSTIHRISIRQIFETIVSKA